LPERHAQNLRRHSSWITCQPQMEPSKPEGRSQQFKRPEHIPRECLLEAVISDGAESWSRRLESIWMVRYDHRFLAHVGGDSRPARIFRSCATIASCQVARRALNAAASGVPFPDATNEYGFISDQPLSRHLPRHDQRRSGAVDKTQRTSCPKCAIGQLPIVGCRLRSARLKLAREIGGRAAPEGVNITEPSGRWVVISTPPSPPCWRQASSGGRKQRSMTVHRGFAGSDCIRTTNRAHTFLEQFAIRHISV
jgi:hypothetical protein